MGILESTLLKSLQIIAIIPFVFTFLIIISFFSRMKPNKEQYSHLFS